MVLCVLCCARELMIREKLEFLLLLKGRSLKDFCRRGVE